MDLAVGVDDTATETQKSEGWAFVVLPQTSVSELQKAAHAIFGGKVFHAKRCSKGKIGEYEKFLIAIRDVASSNAPSLLAHVFDDPSWHTDLKQLAQTVIQSGKIQLDSSVEAALNHVTPPLLTLQRVTANQNLNNDRVEVWLDQSRKTQSFASMMVGTQPHPITATAFSTDLYNKYRQRYFPSAPQMVVDGLHVVPDDQSILIQAADVFGNFAAAYAAWKLGATNIRQLKGEVFGKVFDSPDITPILTSLSLHGNQLEISLQAPGALKLIIS